MSRFGFCSGAYLLQSPNVDAEECMNLYPETPETPGAKAAVTLMHTPGTQIAYQLPEASVPGEFTVNGRGFAAASNFYELLPSKTPNFTQWGELNGPPTSPTQIFSCQTHLLILSNGDLYIFVLTAFTDSSSVFHPANEFFAVNMGQFNGPVLQIDFCDGYFFATIQNSNTFQVSNLEDGTTWSGLFISTISYFPDNIVSMKVDHREAWFFSGKKSIAYYNAGAGYPPFIPIQGAFLEDGAAAAFGTVQANDTVCWISLNERGQGVAKMMGSYVGIRISTLAVEFAWQSYATISDAVAYAYQDQGHNFWVIRFPSANVTWVYDFSTSLWHKRGFWQLANGTYSAHRSTSHMEFGGVHLVGDWASGNIYQMSINLYTDFGNPLRWYRRSPNISAENEWIYFEEIQFDIQKGLGPQPPLLDGDGQPRGPQVILEWFDNVTVKSNSYYLDCGQAGDVNVRIRKTKLGRSRNRSFALSGSDPIPWRIADAYLNATCNGEAIYKKGERLSEQVRKIT
jgi:hypothetical protein